MGRRKSLWLPARHHDRLEVGWFEERHYKEFAVEDWKIRDYLMKAARSGAVSRIEVERTRDRLRVDIHTARPGIVIGRRGAEADRLKKKLEEITGRQNRIQLNIQEIKQPELDAALIAQGICDQLVPGRLPAGHEAGHPDRAEGRRPGHQGPVLGPAGWLRDVAQGAVPRGPGAAAHAASRHRLRLPRGPHDLGPGRREGLIHKGDILPYKVSVEDKITREAAMAVGRDVGPERPAPPDHRRWRSSPRLPGRRGRRDRR